MPLWEHLPGATPIPDASGLKVKGITTRKELLVYEAANIRKVFVKYLSAKPSRRSAKFDYAWALKLHKEMLGDVWRWAGKLRTYDLNIGTSFHHIETSLYNLLQDLRYWEQGTTALLEQAVLLHHKAVCIHPFLDGNGRWSRMLANIWLKLHRHAVTLWPEEAVGSESVIRSEYLQAIYSANEGDYEPLTELHRRYTSDASRGS
jgi:Fic-DOC domain mobile mystery protein B